MLREVDFNEIIAENKKRIDEIYAPYNPVSGLNADGERKRVRIKDVGEFYFPIEMVNDYPKVTRGLSRYGLSRYSEIKGFSPEVFWRDFEKIRIKYDFEYWAFSFITIKDKTSPNDIPFRLNRPQRRLLHKLEILRKQGKPMKFILLKARQWGGSTFIQIYMLWIQLVHRRNWNSVICGDVEGQSRNVRAMITKALKNYPSYLIGKIKFSPFEGSSKNKVIENTNCVVSIGSAQKPDTLRSGDISGAHLTEIGLWKATDGKKPEDLIQSITGSIYDTEYTFLALESTAKGVGNFFHRTWEDAVAGRNNLMAVFVAWFHIEIYSMAVDNYEELIESLNEYEWMLWDLGATLEAIAWYRNKLKDMTETWRMNSEYPSTPTEAFQSTGRRKFRLEDTIKLRRNCIPPIFKGEIIGSAETGYDSTKNLHLSPDERGDLYIWQMPDKKDAKKYSNRYIVSMDVGGVSDTADYTDIVVLDRFWMKDGGVPEIVAEWHGHIDHDKGAWKAAQIALFYANDDQRQSLLVIESNTLETEGTEGDNFEFILDEIVEYYTNLYCRTPADQIRQGVPARWGFHTNTSTKPMVVDHQVKAVRDGLYIERETEAVDEHDYFEIKENGREMGAVEGKHDDRLMARAIGVWVCYKESIPKEISQYKPIKNKRIITEASI